MSEKLTHKEHMARAMLMGRIYDWRDGTYCLSSSGSTIHMSVQDMLCADTLGDISGDQCISRRHHNGAADFEPGSDPAFETPWAKMDEEDGGE